jgi:hypothetical protein
MTGGLTKNLSLLSPWVEALQVLSEERDHFLVGHCIHLQEDSVHTVGLNGGRGREGDRERQGVLEGRRARGRQNRREGW